MYLLLILFFTSFFSIIIMIGIRLILLKKGLSLSKGEVLFEVLHLEKIKHYTIENIKKYEHLSLVVILRFYIRSTNFLKNKYEEVKVKVRNMNTKKIIPNGSPEKEINTFLKMMSEYKHKIREIKHKIHEEEKKL